jgi:hypothetical protein
MEHDPKFAILGIDVIEVKNDRAHRVIIDCAITISPTERFQPRYEAAMQELDRVKT